MPHRNSPACRRRLSACLRKVAGSPGNGICDPVLDGNFVNFNAGDGYHCKTQRTASCGGLLQNNQFLANGGQGIGREHVNNFVIGSAPLLINNIIAHNEGGGAEFLTGDQPLFVNNTLAFNGPLGIHGGLPTIVNSIIWGHTDDLDVPVGQVAFSDVGEPGYASFNNNLSVDPLFVAVAQNDFHLLPESPLINVGNSAYPELPATDFEGDPRLWITLVDIGADEFIGPLQQQLLPVIPVENQLPK